MIVGCLHVHACGGPLGMARSTQLVPLQLVALGGMLDGVGVPCEHPFMLCIVATTTALFQLHDCRCPFWYHRPYHQSHRST